MINTWHCEDSTCNSVFYTDAGIDPNICPFCGSHNLVDSEILEVSEESSL